MDFFGVLQCRLPFFHPVHSKILFYQHLMLHRFKTIIELDTKIPFGGSERIDYITIESKTQK